MRGRTDEGEKPRERAPDVRRYAHMVAVRLVIVAACMVLAACGSSSSLEHSVQRPGDQRPAGAAGLLDAPDGDGEPAVPLTGYCSSSFFSPSLLSAVDGFSVPSSTVAEPGPIRSRTGLPALSVALTA